MKTLTTALLLALLAPGLPAIAAADDQALLKRMYEMRLRYERERQQAENEARANVGLVTQNARGGVDSPTVTELRQQTHQQLARFENSFRCLDVDVENNGGNTVVICGSNAGTVDGSNSTVVAGDDVITVNGGSR